MNAFCKIVVVLGPFLIVACAGTRPVKSTPFGDIIILAGNTSCGKSSVAQALQSELAKREVPFALFGADEFMATLPKQWVNLDASTYHGETKPEGVQFINSHDDKGEKIVVKMGSLVHRLRNAMFPAIDAFAREGINVIFEGVISAKELADGKTILRNQNTYLVYVDCSPRISQIREKNRGGFICLSRGLAEDFDLPDKTIFNIVINTEYLSPENAAAKILESYSADLLK